MAYKTIWEERGIKWVFSGELTNEDFLKCNDELYKDDRSTTIEYQICDFNNIESVSLNSKTIRLVAESGAEFYRINPNKRVSVVTNRPVMVGLANMYMAYFQLATRGDTWATEVFPTIEDAREWLTS